jgi:hypothetical protein
MIARTWRGTTVGTDAERYAAYLHEPGVAECRALPGKQVTSPGGMRITSMKMRAG